MDIDPGEVFDEARRAFGEKDYATALERYAWFFDNATSIDSSYHGVRLSYCLGEWVELSKVYPTAKDELLKRKQAALQEFNSNKSINGFSEYASICDYLKTQDEPVRLFRDIHNSDKDLAERIFCFVYEPLARNAEWEICREYLGNGYKKYQEIIEIFDHSMEFSKKNSGEKGQRIEADCIRHTKEELLWLLNMLAFINAKGEYDSAIKRMEEDFERRGFPKVYLEIMANAPNHAPKPTQ